MAISKGPFEGFTGKLGHLVSYKLKGQQVTRHIGRITKAPSLAQLAIRQKVAIVNNFLGPIVPLINVGYQFEVAGTTKNQYNAAVSYHTKHATAGVYPNIIMDYSKAMISQGALEPVMAPTVTLNGTVMEFTWQVPAVMDGIRNDRTLLLVYCPELGRGNYVLSGARRSAGRDEIELSARYIGKELHCYIAFRASNGNSISDSVWVTDS
jgi:hypothetical protein